MPSRRRPRHGSSSKASQVLLNNSKSGKLSPSTSLPVSLKEIQNSNLTSGGRVLKSTPSENRCSSLNNNTSASSTSFPANNQTNYCCRSGLNGNSLTEKQLRNALFATLTKDQLKIECRRRGQKTNGTRTELLQRLGVKVSQFQKHETLNPNVNLRKSASNMENSIKQQQSTKTKPNRSPNGTATSSFFRKQSLKDREMERGEREKIVLWKRPVQTLKFCILESVTLSHIYGKKLLQHKLILIAVLMLVAILCVLYKIPGHHQLFIDMIRTNTWFVVYWVGLGVLSSVGLGTGLHTFLLYLGPHIASVTLAAYECNALNFPKPPYPDDIICPDVSDTNVPPNLWNIMAKVRLEAFLWGAGTALGELPPYFMAKAARLSGYDPDDDEDLQKFEELKNTKNTKDLTTLDKAKLFMERVVEKVGFFGILACASIPNPLFDLAGITCGHFLVPFWTFFGATLIGKAIIKMHIQKIFVIIAFNEALIEKAVDLLGSVPIFGKWLQEPFKSFLENQKTKLHGRKNVTATAESGNLLAKIFEKVVLAMICYFIISLVNSLAQNYHKRIHKKGGKVLRKVAKD